MSQTNQVAGPHQDQPVYQSGSTLDKAQAAMIMIHGRGATAQDILTLTLELEVPYFAFLAPQAAGYTWYPYRFLEPVERNQPGISSGLQVIGNLIGQLNENGIPAERVFLLGFSQGACLALEYAARHTHRYGGIIGLSGGLIGPQISPDDYSGSLGQTPVFLGCSDIDPHVPRERVEESAAIFQKLDGKVTMRFYPDMGHTVNQDEIDFIIQMVRG
jgi:predicted esterase